MKFVTLIFEPAQRFKDEYTAYQNYERLFVNFTNFISKIKNAGLKVVPEWKSYSEFWEIMKEQMPKDLNDYIFKRYMQFAKK